ncbi:hypothetical protein SORBI_3009G046400, partial [Sorghum bicolor]
ARRSPPAAHPARQRGAQDAEGFFQVQSRRFGRMRSPRRRSPPRRSPPRSPSFLPPELEGACYRCLRFGHVRARCFYPARCYRCWAEGHHAAECPDRRRDFRKLLRGAAGHDAASLVVVPRTAAIQAAEDALELALVAMVVGARPFIRAAAIYEALRNRFNILRDDVDIRAHEPDDFIVRFRRREDRDRVLASTGWGPLIPLRWRPWSRQACGVLAEFSLRVVVALRGLPAHARNVAVAQLRLGTCCCEVQVSNVRDRPIDDDREFFVQAWCKDPSLILPVDSIFIPEPLLPGGPDTGVRRGLRYQVFARVVELQGLRPPPGPPDNVDDDDDADEGDGFGGDADHGFDYDYDPTPRRDSDDDSVDSDPRHRNSHPSYAFRQEDS